MVYYNLEVKAFMFSYSLSTAICLTNLVISRPEFTDTLALKDSVHPIIGKIESVQAVSNDVFASSDSSFNLITGTLVQS